VTAILDAIDDALTAYADHTGSPWPGREPSPDELLEALFGPEDGTPVTDDEDLELLEIQWAQRVVGLIASCPEVRWMRPHENHEPKVEPDWLIHDLHGSFRTRRPSVDPSWLAGEDAWLADRAAREAATR
jgi:hypothetical protein